MLSEEMLLLIACLAAVGLLVFALLEVLWPSQRRHPRGRYPGARAVGSRVRGGRGDGPAARGRRAAPSPRTIPRPSSMPEPDPPVRHAEPVGGPASAPPARPTGGDARAKSLVDAVPYDQSIFGSTVAAPLDGGDAAANPPAPAGVVTRFDPGTVGAGAADDGGGVGTLGPAETAPFGADAVTPLAGDPPVPERDPVPFEECFAMYQEKRYPDVVAAATRALERLAGEVTAPGRLAHETAALWSILGLARQALGDEEGARAAFEEAIHVAPTAERAAYQRHLAALAQMAAHKLIARAEALPDTSGDERITMLRNAVLWLRQGLACAPEDPDLLQALERSSKGLWVSYGHLATALIQRQEFHRARRLIRAALAEDDTPEDRREAFRDLLAATFSGEIGQLTAHAIRTMQDEHERGALTALERAERLLSSIPDEALSPTRREEVNRRLWWGYTKLGVRRLESGEYEDALESLFRALRFGEVDGDRLQETRAALVRALEGATTARVEAIHRLRGAGDRDAAAAEGERLRRLLREGLEVGLSASDLTAALAQSRRVLDEVESGP